MNSDKETFRALWDSLSIEKKKMFTLEPGFNNDIYLELFGIDIIKELKLIEEK